MKENEKTKSFPIAINDTLGLHLHNKHEQGRDLVIMGVLKGTKKEKVADFISFARASQLL